MSSKSKTPQLDDAELNEITTSNLLLVNTINKYAKALGMTFIYFWNALISLLVCNFIRPCQLGCWIIISLMVNIIHLMVQYCLFKGSYSLPQEPFIGKYLGGLVLSMAISNGSSVWENFIQFCKEFIFKIFIFKILDNCLFHGSSVCEKSDRRNRLCLDEGDSYFNFGCTFL